MTDLIVVSPKIINDIEFYVSATGEESGVSKNGLARLCGVARKTVYDLLEQLDQYKYEAGKTVYKSLEPLANNVYSRKVKSDNGAHIVSSYAAALIIAYYAHQSKAANVVAKNSLLKFAARGIDNWIKEITQFSNQGKDDALMNLVLKLVDEVQSVKVIVEESNRLKTITYSNFPGLGHINKEISTENFSKMLDSVELYTVKDWLKMKGISITDKQFRGLSLMVASTYRTLTGNEPKSKFIPITKKDGSSGSRREGNGYKASEFSIIEAGYSKFLAK